MSVVSGIAPGSCEDEDFGTTVPGRDGASGPQFQVQTDAGEPISSQGVFRLAGRDSTVYSGLAWRSGPVTVTGTFDGDVVRGRLTARIRSRHDTCTASAAFTARRMRRPSARPIGPTVPLPRGRLPLDERATYLGGVEGQESTPIALVVENGALVSVDGWVPGPCRRKDGRTEFIGSFIPVLSSPIPLGEDGTFVITVRRKRNAVGPEAVATVHGTFYGNTVRGWARGRSGPFEGWAGCRGEGRFWAKRND